MATDASLGRIASMDQFRGYTVAGMFVVNFLGGLASIHPVLKHNNNYFSYADSIMPSFLFACGFSYRLTVMKAIGAGRAGIARRTIVRSLALILVSLVAFGIGDPIKTWAEMTPEGVREHVAGLLKADLWEVLAIIGACQILILPIIARGWRGPAGGVPGPGVDPRRDLVPVQLGLRPRPT